MTDPTAIIWISDPRDPSGAALVEGEDCVIEPERTDEDEVCLQVTFPGDDDSVVALHFSRREAARLAGVLQYEAARGFELPIVTDVAEAAAICDDCGRKAWSKKAAGLTCLSCNGTYRLAYRLA